MEKRTILIADDEVDLAHYLEKELQKVGYQTCVANDGYAALSKAGVVNPDLILLDIGIRGLHGLEVKNRLNQQEATVNIPVVFLTDKATVDDKVKGFHLQADDFFIKPFNFSELIARVDSITARRKQYEQLYMTDALTGLNNLHVFKKNFTTFFNVARRYKRVFSIAVIDVDDFKTINDTFGHQVGDKVLQSLAETMKKIFRGPDILIRYGGDEFVVLFPETDEAQTQVAMERLKTAVRELKVPTGEGGGDISFSISIGVASFHESFKRETELFEFADQNMYKDKKHNKTAMKKANARSKTGTP